MHPDFFECGNKDHINMFLNNLSNKNGQPGNLEKWKCQIK